MAVDLSYQTAFDQFPITPHGVFAIVPKPTKLNMVEHVRQFSADVRRMHEWCHSMWPDASGEDDPNHWIVHGTSFWFARKEQAMTFKLVFG